MMSAKLNSREIDDRAAEWAARLDAGELPANEQAELNAWLDEDARHLGAFAKARAVLAHTERARALGPDFDPSNFVTHTARKKGAATTRRQLMLIGGIAASAVAFVGGGVLVWLNSDQRTYSTRIGETRVVPLEDGSVVTLNTDTEIAVNYTATRRDIRLLRGEALFDVAKNKKRPFIVDADGTTVRAVGTSFTVQLLPNAPVRVLVREGIVEVKRPAVPQAPPIQISADTRAVAPPDAPILAQRVAKAEVNRALAWRVGRLAFEGETLRQAAEEFSRYSETKIVIDDPTIANETITGLFVSNDPVGFSKAVAVSLGLRADVGDGQVRLAR
jgi:transmembrane sensor